MSRRVALLSVTVLFVASVLIRAPFLHRPLDGEHDWLTLHTLLTVSIWNAVGLQAAHYSLVMTWPNDADRFISYADPRSTVQDAKGNSYFIAFPPFAFLLAFVSLKLFHLPPAAIWLTWINIVFLFPATFCLYMLLERLFPPSRILLGRWVSALGIALFLFDRSVLLSIANLYFPLILIVPLWIVSVFVYCIIQDEDQLDFIRVAGFFLLVFIMCYCDWLGFAAAGSFVLGAFVYEASRRTKLWLAAVSIAAPIAAGTLTLFQYASIGGMRALLAGLAFRLQARAGLSAADSPLGLTLWNRHTYVRILDLYLEQHAVLLLMIWGLCCLWLFSMDRLSIASWTENGGRLILLLGLPVLADHLLLVNHTAIHNYANLKTTPLLSVVFVLLLGGAIGHMRRAEENGPRQIGDKSVVVRASMLTLIACILSARSYVAEVRYDLRPADSRLGNAIHRLAKRDQVVFLVKRDSGDKVTPNLIYFSRRNIQMVVDERQAEVFLQKHNENQGIIFHATLAGDLVGTPLVIGPGQ